MAILSLEHSTLLDISRGQAGSFSSSEGATQHQAVSELLMQSNMFLEKMPWKVGNMANGHSFTYRTSLITPTWRRASFGVRPDRGTRSMTEVSAGHMVSYWEVDKVVIESGNKDSNIAQEVEAFHQGNAHELARAAIYGTETGILDEFTGLARYYSDKTDAIGKNFIIDADSATTATDLKSIYLVGASPNTVSMFVPKDRPMGFQIYNPGGESGTFLSQTAPVLGQKNVTDGRMLVYGQYFYSWAGLVVEDPRYCVRIANISPSALVDDGSSGPKLYQLMQRAANTIMTGKPGVNYFWIMPRGLVATLISQSTSAVQNSSLVTSQLGDNGVMTQMFGGFPICIEDALDAVDEGKVS